MLDRADQQAHLEQARANLALAQRLLGESPVDPVAVQWAVTMVFYCAVHCVEAHLANFDLDSTDHADRDNLMHDANVDVPDAVYASYRLLYARSRDARYRLVRHHADYVQQVLIGRELAVIAKWAGT